ncbi:divalent-cation tolerance protein CutA [Methylocystis heyeri]|nr:divalent-cation tolerance protein CutA [Methylocystis heyeri]
MPAPFSMVVTTVANDEKAREIARAALEARLAACVQLYSIDSHYIWEGEAHEDSEIAIHLKISTADFEPLRELIRRHHDYEIPEILRFDIADGDPAYLAWLGDTVRK